MIKNILLDMGNVLLLFNPEIPLNQVCKTEEEKDSIRKAYFEGEEWIKTDYGEIKDKDLVDTIKHKVPEKYHESLRKVAEIYDTHMVGLEGAKEFCDYIKNKGYGIYILSNASDRFYQYFPRFLPLNYFDGVVVSSDIHMIKPYEGIYKYILDKYKLNPEECLFIDDRKENIEGAEKFNIKVELFKKNFNEIIKKYNL